MDNKESILEQLITIRRYLHQNPEIGFKTPKTKTYLKELIQNKSYNKNLSLSFYEIKNSLIVILTNNPQGKILGFRADIDALEILEENNVSYKSVNNYMHACGHDAHTAILMVTLLYLLAHDNLINGTIKFIFQTAEEGPNNGGAYYLANHPLIKDIEEIYAIHVNSEIQAGSIAIKKGPIMAESQAFKIAIFGKSSHITTYHQGVDALKIGLKIVEEISNIKTTFISPSTPSLIGIGSFKSGKAPNVISDYTIIEGTIRSFSDSIKQAIITKIKEIVKVNTKLFIAKYKILFNKGYPPIINNPSCTNFVIDCAKNINLNTILLEEPFFLSDDFSRYLRHSKGAYFFLGTKKDSSIALHSSLFNIDEEAMYDGWRLYLEIVTNFFM